MVSDIRQPTYLMSRWQQDFKELFQLFTETASPLSNSDSSESPAIDSESLAFYLDLKFCDMHNQAGGFCLEQ